MSEPGAAARPLAGSSPIDGSDSYETSAWQRLVLTARPRATKANAFAAVLAILLGFAMATQVRQNQVLGLESLRQSELVTIQDNATLLSSRLDQNAREVQVTREELVNDSTGGAAALTAAGIQIDGSRVSAPYIIVAIGDPRTMSSAMEMPGVLSANVRELPATITITQGTDLVVGALHTLSEPRYARPVPSP